MVAAWATLFFLTLPGRMEGDKGRAATSLPSTAAAPPSSPSAGGASSTCAAGGAVWC